MKSNLQNVRLIALLIVITATLLAQPMQGQIIVSFTETSSSSLTVFYNGMDITATGVSNTRADQWTVTIPQSLPPFIVSWAEPENPGLLPNLTGWNQILWDSSTSSSTQLLVFSDNFLNGTGFPNGNFELINGVINMQFTDVSDGVVTTPDSGSTFGLLSLAFVAFFGASRLRSIRLA